MIHDPPRLKPLLIWMLIIIGIADLFALAGVALAQWIMASMSAVRWTDANWAALPGYVLGRITSWRWHAPFGIFILWCVLGLFALMLYRQSMRIYKVRTAHIVRVWAYSSVAFLPLAVFGFLAAFTLAEAIANMGSWQNRRMYYWLYDSPAIFGLLALIHGIWSIGQGYRKYLRMPHSLGIAIVSQIMAGLCVMIIGLRVFIN